MDNIKSSIGTQAKKRLREKMKSGPLDCDTVSAELVLRRSPETRCVCEAETYFGRPNRGRPACSDLLPSAGFLRSTTRDEGQ